jgi:hypothetical protein
VRIPWWAALLLGLAGVFAWALVMLALIPNAWLEAWLAP